MRRGDLEHMVFLIYRIYVAWSHLEEVLDDCYDLQCFHPCLTGECFFFSNTTTAAPFKGERWKVLVAEVEREDTRFSSLSYSETTECENCILELKRLAAESEECS